MAGEDGHKVMDKDGQMATDITELMDTEIIWVTEDTEAMEDMDGLMVDMEDGTVVVMAAMDTVIILGAIIMPWGCIQWVKRIGVIFTNHLSQLIQFTNTWTQSQYLCRKESRELAIFWVK